MASIRDRKWSGVWWKCPDAGLDNPRVHGTLSFSDDGLMELELEPVSSEPNIECAFGKNNVIWGEDKYGLPITLFNACPQHFSGIGVEKILVNYALMGVHLKSMNVPYFTGVTVYYPNLNDFCIFRRIVQRDNEHSVSFELNTDKKEYIIPIGKETEWAFISRYQIHKQRENLTVQISQNTFFSIRSQREESMNFFYKQIREFSDFLSIALQNKQTPSIILFNRQNDPINYELYFKVESCSSYICHLIGDSSPNSRLKEILKKWHDNYEQIAPIYKYLEHSQYSRQGFGGVPEFLLVEFALEGYFKRFHNKIKTSNRDIQKSKEELETLLQYYSGIEIIHNLKLNIDSVVATRNAYAHLVPEEEHKGIELSSAHEIWIATEKLRILLLCCILDYMGFSIGEIDTNFKTAPIILPELYQNDFLFE